MKATYLDVVYAVAICILAVLFAISFPTSDPNAGLSMLVYMAGAVAVFAVIYRTLKKRDSGMLEPISRRPATPLGTAVHVLWICLGSLLIFLLWYLHSFAANLGAVIVGAAVLGLPVVRYLGHRYGLQGIALVSILVAIILVATSTVEPHFRPHAG